MENETLFFDRMKNIFKDEFDQFKVNLNEVHQPAFFLNELKADKNDILDMIDFEYRVSDYSSRSYYHNIDYIGKTIVNELGLIYPQEMSASIPAQVLNPGEKTIIVDMCSAPGGKTINLANISKDNALLISNEYEYKRAMILVSNIERMGISNIIVTNKSGDELAKNLFNTADYVLLDAPCSGEGMIRKNRSILEEYTLANVELCARRQNDLIENAYDILKCGGYLVYSTCTYSKEENEDVINAFLKRHDDMEVLMIDEKYPRRGIGNDKCVRFSVLEHTEGQFIALLKKKGDNLPSNITYRKTIKNKLVEAFIRDQLDLDDYYLYEQNGFFYLSLVPLIEMNRNVLRYGIFIGEIKKNIFHPAHHLYRSNKLRKHFKKVIDLNHEEYINYLKGLSVYKEADNGYHLLTYKGYAFSYTKVSNNELKNKYPKGLRW